MSNNKKEGASKESRGMYGFDPSGLERAAEAAKYLDSSPNAGKAFELALKEEELKVTKEQRLIKENEIYHTKMQQEEKRKTMQMEIELQKDKSRYDDRLAKERINYRLQQERATNEENLRRQEESTKRQEAFKQATLEYEHQLKLKQDKERLINKYNVKSEIEKKHFDLTEKKLRIIESEKRTTSKEVASVSLQLIGQGLKDFLSSKSMFFKVVGGLTGAYIFSFWCKSGIQVFYKMLSARMMTPKLIRETSKIPLNKMYKYPIKLYNKLAAKNEKILKGIVLKPELESQLRVISNAVLNRKKHYAPFRNLLFYGPPGTGKTLFAKQLAKRSGLDFAILTGADVAPLGPLAVYELHKIFDWAEASSNGLLIFVDEADAFLRRRAGDELISENLRNAINAFLYRSGTPSTKFMIVLATNSPQLLDEAIQDRIDEMVFFDRPSVRERTHILYHYLLQYCKPKRSFFDQLRMWKCHPSSFGQKMKSINISQLDSDYIEDIAKRTEGFSGRELTKLVVSWHDAAFAKDNPVLDKETVETVLTRHLEQNQTKDKWNVLQKEYFDMMHSKL